MGLNYINKDIKWLDNVPESWSIKKIKSCGKLSGRIGWQGLTSDEYTDEGAYLITGIDFKNGTIDWNSCVHVPMKRWSEAIGVQIKENDLLITKDGTVGKVALVKDMPYETSLNSGVLLIRTSSDIDNKFLYYVLLSNVFWEWFNRINAGNSTIIHLYQHDFNNFMFACPPKKEQLKIASFLDLKVGALDKSIEIIQKQIDLLKQYKKTIISEKVTQGLNPKELNEINLKAIKKINKSYEISKLRYVCNLFNGNSISDDEKPNYEDSLNARPYISSKDIDVNTQEIDYNNGMYVKYDDKSFKIAKKNSILLCIEGGSAGRKIAYLDRDVSFVNKLCCFECNTVYSKYLFYTLMSNYFTEDFYLNMSGLIGGVSLSVLKGMNIVVPPFNEQIEIANYLDEKCESLNILINQKQLALDKLIKYKESLIFEYVTGKKRVEVD